MQNNCDTTIQDTFQEPRKRFWLRSRKRPKSDAVSIGSMDTSTDSEVGKKKKRRRITEVATGIFNSTSTGTKLGDTLHRSFTMQSNSTRLSFIEDISGMATLRRKRKGSIESASNVTLRSWMLDVANVNGKDYANGALSRSEVKRQEAIYELYCGENVLLHDMNILKEYYYEPLLDTGILSGDELFTLFGDIACLIQVHSKLRDALLDLRDDNGFTIAVGPTILNWLPTLSNPYLERCRTQIWAKHLLDDKRLTSKRFQSFLKKRLESPHSMDLWTCLDVARSRIVKYPLLIKEILRHTPTDHPDQISLKESYDVLSKLLKDIDGAMGRAECKLAQSKIHIKLDYDPEKCIENATGLITEGPLKDVRGTKFHCFLFDTCFAITRRTRCTNRKYQLCSTVIAKDEMRVLSNEKSALALNRDGFKVGDHLLLASDGHGKRHWIDSFNKINRTDIDVLASMLETEGKENRPDIILPDESQCRNRSNTYENHFTLSLRKTLAKEKKRRGIDYT
ncbi:hypothetical protein KM043_000410 [Ampulex compressa]|nr:hypothetical protein KM043_000410 [Ampulex compressa]